ncbi:MAG: DUF3570 domain-containing protein [Chlorobium sp.]|nr:MAG: DUF3570 domain-containing protein [Chlorobium sp.]
MGSISSTTSTVVRTALATAALALPSLQFANAEAPPENGVVSFKYLHYQDSQIGDGVTVISGASSAGSSSRMGVNAYSMTALVPVAGEWSIGTTYTSDSVSGASPMYHSSGLTKMTDLRRAVDVELTRYFSRGTLSIGTSYSKESDYLSRGYSVQGSLSTEDKNTTFTLGGSMNSDDINPVIPPYGDYKKKVYSGIFGITRIVTKRDIVQLNIGYSNGNGDFSDPYKVNDNRPTLKNNATVLTRWNHHFDWTDGTAKLSYRYYTDTFGVRAHTLEGEYVQPLRNGWTLTPLLRLYSQSEANFYVAVGAAEKADPTTPTQPPANAIYYSEDQRLSAFGAITLGLKVSKQLNQDWLVDVKYEEYEQRSSWSVNGNGDPGLAPFGARSIQVGLSRKF